MRVSHLLALALIALIVFRLTQTVRDSPAPEAERHTGNGFIRTSGSLIRTTGRDSNGLRFNDEGSEQQDATGSAILSILRRLASSSPAGSEKLMLEALPNQAAATPVPLSPRERLRNSEYRRPALTKEYGAPKTYDGRVRRHFDSRTLLVSTATVGECVVEDFEGADGISDGSKTTFDAWQIGSRTVTNSEGEQRPVTRMMHAAPALPLWDQYGRALNRDVLPPETVRGTSIHTSTALDKRPR